MIEAVEAGAAPARLTLARSRGTFPTYKTPRLATQAIAEITNGTRSPKKEECDLNGSPKPV